MKFTLVGNERPIALAYAHLYYIQDQPTDLYLALLLAYQISSRIPQDSSLDFHALTQPVVDYMATPEDFVISQQPRVSEQSPSVANNDMQLYGEEIIFEGICDTENLKREEGCLCCEVVPSIAGIGTAACPILSCIYLVLCHGPVGCFCARRVANSWKLSRIRRIHYTRKNHLFVCRCADENIHIELA